MGANRNYCFSKRGLMISWMTAESTLISGKFGLLKKCQEEAPAEIQWEIFVNGFPEKGTL